METSAYYLSKKRIAARFNRASESYEAYADVQLEIVKRVASIMDGAIGAGELWCDFGSGSGMLLERLKTLPGGAQVVCFDLAYAPLRRSVRSRRTGLAVNGDIDFPPVKPETFHGAAAVSAIQWTASPEDALRGIARMLKPSGRLYFSVFVDGSFAELVETRARMGLPASVWLPTASELLMTLDRAGFDVSVDDVEEFNATRNFTDALAALGSLSDIGVTATGGRLLNRTELDKLCKNYTLTFSKNGNVPLTYRAIVGKVVKRWQKVFL